MKTKDKIILIIILIVSLLGAWATNAQEVKINALAGFKSLEAGASITNEESELIYGVSASVVDSSLASDRANRNDKGKHHEFNGDAVPACFLLSGAKFDRLNIIGKIGGAYVSQSINNEPTKDLFLALGIMASYDFSERCALIGSWDSVNSVQFGISLTL